MVPVHSNTRPYAEKDITLNSDTSSVTCKVRIPLEETKKLDIQTLFRSGILHPGKNGTLSWQVDGQPIGTISFQYEDNQLTLLYQYKTLDNHWLPVKQTIALTKVNSSDGFMQHRLICPSCQGKVKQLSGFGKYFLCRHCYQFPYGSLRGTAAKYDYQTHSNNSMPVSYWEDSKIERQRLNKLSLKHCELIVKEEPSTSSATLGAG